jgi:hypothetical protein
VRPITGTAADQTAPLTTTGLGGIQPVLRGMGPAALEEQQGYGRTLGAIPGKLDDAAASAKLQNNTLDEMATADNGSWTSGKWAPQAESFREGLQSVAKGLGVNTPGLDQAVGSYQDFVKLAGNISRQASRETGGSNVGVEEMQLINKSLPSPETSDQGFRIIAPQLKGLNDFKIAQQQAAGTWKGAYGTLGPNPNAPPGPNNQDFMTTWNNNSSPAAFVTHRMQVENPQAFNAMVATMAKAPGGTQAIKNLIAQMKWANQYGLFDTGSPAAQ